MNIKDVNMAVCYQDMVLPKQLNSHGTMFGGDVCAIIDKAAAILVKLKTDQKFVTLKFDELIFENPIYSGDVIQVFGKVTHIGNTSIKVYAEAYAVTNTTQLLVTRSTVTFVAIDENSKPTPVKIVESSK